ncbi:MAG TPA: hypothetical protein ENJ92_00580 [Chloroflexi bacterium]|nr:hypothetical protein [Chloroflexota bacterium]
MYSFSPKYGYDGGTIVAVFGPKFEQLQKTFWHQLQDAYHSSKYPLGGDMRSHDYYPSQKRYPRNWISIFSGKKEDVENLQGHHCQNLLVIVDEASRMDPEILEALESCVTSKNSRILCAGNPLRLSGPFYEHCNDPRNDELKALGLRNVIHGSALESPNYIYDKEIFPGMATRNWVNEQKEKYSEQSAYYQARVLGIFPKNPENCLIPLWAIEEACTRGDEQAIRADDNDRVVAMDIARQGKDQSVIIGLAGDLVTGIRAKHTPDSIVAADWLWTTWKDWGGKVAIDENGLGGGPYDYLRGIKRVPVRGFIAQRAAQNNERFANLKAEAGWSLRKRFVDGMIAIPPSEHRDRLKADLAAYLIDEDNRGRTKIVDPSRSPDFGDALLIAHWCQNSSKLGQLDIEMGKSSRNANWETIW